MTVQDGHLDSEALIAILGGQIDLQSTHPSAVHARSCEGCASLVSEVQKKEEALRTLARYTSGEAGTGCLPDAAIGELAAGVAASDNPTQWLAHVVKCDVCGKKLREATEDFSRELAPEETAMLPQLKSGTSAWTEQMARRAGIPVVSPKSKGWYWALPVAAAALASVVFVTWFWTQRPTQVGTDVLLAEAYSARRPFPYRLPDRGYSPVTQQRSQGESALSKPRSLLDAEARLSGEQLRYPARPESLRLRATAELLELQPDAAIASLEKARNAAPQDVPILFDLSVAYALRADLQDRAKDRGAALDSFGKVLKTRAKQPDGSLQSSSCIRKTVPVSRCR